MLVWLRPWTPLITDEEIIANVIKIGEFVRNLIIIIGAIFCQVDKRKILGHDNPLITSGNQKWKGAAPIFIRRAEFKIIWFFKDERLSSKKESEVTTAKIIKEEAKAWARKYFIAASLE